MFDYKSRGGGTFNTDYCARFSLISLALLIALLRWIPPIKTHGVGISTSPQNRFLKSRNGSMSMKKLVKMTDDPSVFSGLYIGSLFEMFLE